MQKLHEYGGFKVDRNELSKLFSLIYTNPAYSNKELELDSGFGKNKIDNLKIYLRDFGLLCKDYSPTDLAHIIFENDKYFEDEITLWILFFHWANRESNPFLFYLINELGDFKEQDSIKQAFISWAIDNDIKTEYTKKDFVGGLISRTITAMSDNEAFRSLNIITEHTGRYFRAIPYKMHPLLLGYVLYRNREKRATTSFSELLTESNNISKVFNLDRENLQNQIYTLRDYSLVNYVQTADLHNIVYIYQDPPLELIKQYYEQS